MDRVDAWLSRLLLPDNLELAAMPKHVAELGFTLALLWFLWPVVLFCWIRGDFE